ncbi:hypothetical protein [Pelosinus sp. IPA-1]|uniref:hypothetical protein n=1 Tax=Pelosinus sp. IPA-1 TaxID=3029569 RepID=UPI00243620BF|nr:hypothetical protein [Pelosinus sp. IPA-1]GMB01052.1 hypothetical protein PIPA1_38510 [Pelosinus sp. IPA-1]
MSKVNPKKVLSEELIKSMQETAAMIVTYRDALIENGISEQDALKMAIAYQGQQLEVAFKANIEQQKIMLLGNGEKLN